MTITMTFREHPQRAIQETCDLVDKNCCSISREMVGVFFLFDLKDTL